MKHFSITSFLLCITFASFSQGISGKIKDTEGNPVPYSTIFVKELTMGTTSNSDGNYLIKLSQGTYHVQFRCMGYTPKEEVFVVDSSYLVKDIILSTQTINLQEIRIYASNEDPAYPIMRRAISMAPYYLNQIQHFEANLYIKTTAKLDKIPKLLLNKINIDANGSKINQGDVIVGESFSEITFDAPDKYNQKVISSNMSSAEKKSETMDIGLIPISIYAPKVNNLIMPLSPNALSHYNFKLVGSFGEGNNLVNKIKITPKVKGKQFVTGHINIIDRLWCAHSAQLVNSQMFGDINVDIQHAEIKDKTWIPINQKILIDGSFMGVKGKGIYTSSIKYTKIEENKTLKRPLLLEEYDKEQKIEKDIVEKEQKELSDRQKKIEAILKKEKMKNRDAIVLARLTNQEAKASQPKKEKSKQLEIEDNYNISKKDSTAPNNKDAAFWDSIRPNPLTPDEFKSFRKSDSIQLVKANAKPDSIQNKKKKLYFGKYISGGQIAGSDSTFTLRYDGFLNPSLLSFNAVDGITYYQNLRFLKKFKTGNEFTLSPQIGYAFSSEQVLWQVNSTLKYAPLKMGRASLGFGHTTSDYLNPYSAISPLVNSVSSLCFKENYARYFRQNFFRMTNSIEVKNGLFFNTSVGYYDRTHLLNTTNFSFYHNKLKYHENTIVLPDKTTLTPTSQKDAIVGLSLDYTPEMHYRIRAGVKYRSFSNWPTFTLAFKKTIPNIANSSGSWSYVESIIKQRIKVGAFGEINYMIHGGIFLNNSNVNFADYAQIATTYSPFEVKTNNMQFQLLPYYMYNTNKSFAKGAFTYSSPYIALKYLPWVSERSWKENLHLTYLSTPNLRNYTEVGYSISEIIMAGSVSIFAGYENAKFKSWGMKFSFAF